MGHQVGSDLELQKNQLIEPVLDLRTSLPPSPRISQLFSLSGSLLGYDGVDLLGHAGLATVEAGTTLNDFRFLAGLNRVESIVGKWTFAPSIDGSTNKGLNTLPPAPGVPQTIGTLAPFSISGQSRLPSGFERAPDTDGVGDLAQPSTGSFLKRYVPSWKAHDGADLLDGYHATLEKMAYAIAVRAPGGHLRVPLDPTEADHAVPRQYVDNNRGGIRVRTAVAYATVAALPPFTYSSVNKTYTANANGALSVDGSAPETGERLMLKTQVDARQNGIAVVTQPGSAGAAWVLQRVYSPTNPDPDGLGNTDYGDYYAVTKGATLAGSTWVASGSAQGPTTRIITVDTDPLFFNLFQISQPIGAGRGVTMAGGKVHHWKSAYAPGDLKTLLYLASDVDGSAALDKLALFGATGFWNTAGTANRLQIPTGLSLPVFRNTPLVVTDLTATDWSVTPAGGNTVSLGDNTNPFTSFYLLRSAAAGVFSDVLGYTAGTSTVRSRAWSTFVSDISALIGVTFAAPTVAVDVIAAAAGSLSTALRSDARLALSLAIMPTWTGKHIFSATATDLKAAIGTPVAATRVLIVDDDATSTARTLKTVDKTGFQSWLGTQSNVALETNAVGYGVSGLLFGDDANLSFDGTKLGVGVAAATARIQIAAGSTTVAPLRLAPIANSLLTTPLAGVIETDLAAALPFAARLYFTDGTPTRHALAHLEDLSFTNDPAAVPSGGLVYGGGANSTTSTMNLGISYLPVTFFARWSEAAGVVSYSPVFSTRPSNQYLFGFSIADNGALVVNHYDGTVPGVFRNPISVAGFRARYLSGGRIVDVALVKTATQYILYANGVQIAVASPAYISDPVGMDTVHWFIQSTSYFSGIAYSGRFFNRDLSAQEIMNLSRYGAVDPGDQWGSFTGGYTSNFTAGLDGWDSQSGIGAAGSPATAPVNTGVDGAGVPPSDGWQRSIRSDPTAGSIGFYRAMNGGEQFPSDNKRYRVVATLFAPAGSSYTHVHFSRYGTPATSYPGVALPLGAAGGFTWDVQNATGGIQYPLFRVGNVGAVTTVAQNQKIYLKDYRFHRLGAVIDLDFAVGCRGIVPDRSGKYHALLTGPGYAHLISTCPGAGVPKVPSESDPINGGGLYVRSDISYLVRKPFTDNSSQTLFHNLGVGARCSVTVWDDTAAPATTARLITAQVAQFSVDAVTVSVGLIGAPSTPKQLLVRVAA